MTDSTSLVSILKSPTIHKLLISSQINLVCVLSGSLWCCSWNGIVDDDVQDELRGALDVQARHLYGLIHARWIVTARGLAKMVSNSSSALFVNVSNKACTSLRNTSVAISGDVLASFVNPSLSSQSASRTCHMKSQSSYTAGAVKICTLRSRHATVRLTGRILAPRSLTSSSSSILH